MVLKKFAVSKTVLQIRVPYRPTDSKLSALSADRDKLPSGKQILALTLTYVLVEFFHLSYFSWLLLSHKMQIINILWCSYKFKLEDAADVKPQIPLLNNRIYDNKFESQFYMISDSNKVMLSVMQIIHDLALLYLIYSISSPSAVYSVYMQWVMSTQIMQNCPKVNTLYDCT